MPEPEPVAETKPAAPELREISAAGRRGDIATGFVNRLKLPDDRVLNSKGGNIEIYERVLEDDQVYSTFQQRRRAITSREWLVEPGGDKPIDKEAAEFIEQQLHHIRWDEKTNKMAAGLFYGYAVAEVLWKIEGGKVCIDQLKVRKQKRFRFDEDGRLMLLRAGKQPEAMPDRKFWVFSVGADHDDEPYGKGLAHWLYWPVWFKRNDLKFWLILIDKLGIPTVKGTYAKGASKEEQAAFLETLSAVQNEGAIMIPEGMLIELMEAASKGSVGQEALFELMNSAIAKVVLSQTMTTEDGSSQSQANVHMEVRQDVTESDADLIDDSFTQSVVSWLIAWNFPGAALPRVRRDFEEADDANFIAERDEKLWKMGARPTAEYAEEQYPGWKFPVTAETMGTGDPGGAPGAPLPIPPGAAEFAEAQRDQIDQVVSEMLAADDWPMVMQAVIGPIEDLLNQSNSYTEFVGLVAEALAKMDVAVIQQRLARALFTARLAANLDADIGV